MCTHHTAAASVTLNEEISDTKIYYTEVNTKMYFIKEVHNVFSF